MCIDRLDYLFKEAVNYARRTGKEFSKEFIQRSGALRSSMGFQLYKDGILVKEDFQEIPGSKETKKDGTSKYPDQSKEGVNTGKVAASEAAQKTTAQIFGIMVAGMHYAIYVENYGYDVLTGATLWLEDNVEEELRKVFQGTSVKITKIQ